MIKARSGDAIVLGLSAENIRRLQAGQPMKFSLRELGIDQTMYIVAGDTEQSILDDLGMDNRLRHAVELKA